MSSLDDNRGVDAASDIEARRQAQEHQAQLTEALASVRRLQEEHNRAEYLSFLNNVSKAAITSKKPVELLNQVVDEVQRTFQFDHISIGVVDYARKEIEVRAESGREQYRLGLGKRVPLEAGVLGIAAQRNELRVGGLEHGAAVDQPTVEERSSEGQRAGLRDDRLVQVAEGRSPGHSSRL